MFSRPRQFQYIQSMKMTECKNLVITHCNKASRQNKSHCKETNEYLGFRYPFAWSQNANFRALMRIFLAIIRKCCESEYQHWQKLNCSLIFVDKRLCWRSKMKVSHGRWIIRKGKLWFMNGRNQNVCNILFWLSVIYFQNTAFPAQNDQSCNPFMALKS